jgi:hypothetical protein
MRCSHCVAFCTCAYMEFLFIEISMYEGYVCRELGIAIVPYCPLGRGFFSNADLEADNLHLVCDLPLHLHRILLVYSRILISLSLC